MEMAGTLSESSGVGRNSEEISGVHQRYHSGEALAEWRSSEQVENGIASTSPPYWDTDDEDDDDNGLKPSKLYKKYTWTVEEFSQINKRELRSSAFEVAGYKWYILIYPQGCDVCNHLSLFLCVANHDKLLPGWSHFAQFTIAVVNKDPKRTKYSDTLHRFWKKEHDWGWKKFMELSKVMDGFIDATDSLTIKAQVQVIRERANRPFRCLDCTYRRELIRVYLSNVEAMCRRFVEERRSKLGKLIEDKSRWSSFCTFWNGIDQNAKHLISREKSDVVLRIVVKHFFIEKEVSSTLVMDSLHSGLKCIEGMSKNKKYKEKSPYVDELLVPMVSLENDIFILADDVLHLVERAATEPLPPKDDKGPQNRTKEGGSIEDLIMDSIEHDERRLTELGRRTIEIFALAQIFSKIEVAYQEAVALKRQEELIREEEAASLAESEHKAKRGIEREKKSKKKQAKQKRNGRKGKDNKGKDEKTNLVVGDDTIPEGSATPDDRTEEEQDRFEKPIITVDDVLDLSDSLDCVTETLQPDSDERESSPVCWDTDTSEIRPPSAESMRSEISVLESNQTGKGERKIPSAMYDSSSTCSTDSVPSVVRNVTHKEHLQANQGIPKSPGRRNQWDETKGNSTSWTSDLHGRSSETAIDKTHSNTIDKAHSNAVDKAHSNAVDKGHSNAVDKAHSNDPLRSSTADSEPDSVPQSLPEQPSLHYQPVVKKERNSSKGCVDAEKPLKEKTTAQTTTPSKNQLKSEPKIVQQSPSAGPSNKWVNEKRPDSQQPPKDPKPVEKPSVQQVPTIMSRPLSAPVIVAAPKPTPARIISTTVQTTTTPLLARSVSAAGRLGADPSAPPSYVLPQSYRNAIMGVSSASVSSDYYPSSSSLGVNLLPQSTYQTTSSGFIQPPPVFLDHRTQQPQQPIKRNLSFGMMDQQQQHHVMPQNGGPHQWIHQNIIGRPDFAAAACISGRQATQNAMSEFPHLDIINDLLDDENGIGRVSNFVNGPHNLNRQFTFPGYIGMWGDSDTSASSSSPSCRLERSVSYRGGDSILQQRQQHQQHGGYDTFQQENGRHYVNGGQMMDGLVPISNPNHHHHNQQQQWQIGGGSSVMGNRNNEQEGLFSYGISEFPSNEFLGSCTNANNGGYHHVFRPSNGH
ncbi:TNF receptor-associated factor homolog 1a-like [Impatiens glandulifera]|uniref:TNF receptor-associated factor homolog 1a-like n=1 Tax=Impatiens glandulifera TaxID=253017 RepID=UPI001FB0CA13|nr:TNF receptor-associated factor homolog 1a-like [Impatiens glandulifera]